MNKGLVFVLSASSLLLAACGEDRPAILELSGSAMGTSFSIKLPEMPAGVEAGTLRDDIDSLLSDIEMKMSTYRIDSEISQFNVSDSLNWQPVSLEFCRAAEESLAISAMTSGAFDITVGPLVNLWGFGPDGSIQQPPSDPDIAAARSRVGFSHLQTDCSVPAIRKDIKRLYLDMSAYAKGYAVDRVAEALDKLNVPDYLVEIGGEMKLRGHNAERKKWAVAIEEPLQDQRRVHTVFRLTDQAVATSGDYRNFFEFGGAHYSHTIDTRTGRPVTHNLASVTVIGDTAAVADAMATALLVLGPEDGMQLALTERIAAFFLVRSDAGFEEKMTPAFAAIGRES
jgi:thiamine biosynthesis lipoprotein